MAPVVVLITGCSSGIGLAISTYLAKESEHEFKIYATVKELSDISDLKKAAGESLDKTLFIRELDVTKNASVMSTVEEVLRENDKIDVVINNAAAAWADDELYQESLDSLDHAQTAMEVIFWGAARVMQTVLPSMKSHKSGHIINVTSVSGVEGCPFLSFYSASKFALEGLSEGLAAVLRKGYGIRTSILELGPVSSTAKVNWENSFTECCKNWDDASKTLFQEYLVKDMLPAMNQSRTPQEIAQLVEKIILSNEPHLRYQSDEFQTKKVSAILVDPTGDSLCQIHQTFR